MKTPPLSLDLWVSTSIFMSITGKTDPLGDEKLISSTVSRLAPPDPSAPQPTVHQQRDIRHSPLLMRRAG